MHMLVTIVLSLLLSSCRVIILRQMITIVIRMCIFIYLIWNADLFTFLVFLGGYGQFGSFCLNFRKYSYFLAAFELQVGP